MPAPPKCFGARARGARHTPGKMNKLEEAYSKYLDELKAKGEIFHWDFEKVTLVIADGEERVRYTPDFLVFRAPDSQIEFHETKGFMRDDAAVKIKVAAAAHPRFVFKLVKQIAKKNGGGWEIKNYSPEPEPEESLLEELGAQEYHPRALFGDGLVID